MQPIYLMGYMGSGKSTLGRELHRLTQLDFIDLDNYIEERYGMTVSEIFAKDGERGFRDIEAEILRSTVSLTDTIIALGGGTPCHNGNMDWLLDHGTTVYLDASVEKLYQRLLHSRYKRPLIAALDDTELMNYILTSLEARMPHYRRAGHAFDADHLDCEAEREISAREFAQRFGLPLK